MKGPPVPICSAVVWLHMVDSAFLRHLQSKHPSTGKSLTPKPRAVWLRLHTRYRRGKNYTGDLSSYGVTALSRPILARRQYSYIGTMNPDSGLRAPRRVSLRTDGVAPSSAFHALSASHLPR